MTGATGDLTPEGTDEAFDPGERREVEDPAHAGEVTVAQIRHASAGRGPEPEDPAFGFERHPTPGETEAEPEAAPPGRETRIGGDERADAEEHF